MEELSVKNATEKQTITQEKHECKCPHCGYKGDGFTAGIILDPFCGTGTTIARAIQLGRRGIGIDGSSEYCKIAKERISQKELF